LIGDNGQAYGIRADMWALGLSLHEIIAGKQPFANMSSFQTMMAIRSWTPTIPSSPKISNDMKQLITHLYINSLIFLYFLIFVIYF
jgi:serine/threonine protein kinase